MASLLCLCSDKLLDAVPVFCRRLEKHWPDHPPLLIAGFTKPEIPIDADFVSLGKFEDYPVGKWSDALLAALDYVEETFILFLEDYWLTHGVNDAAVTTTRSLIAGSDSILKVDLHGDRMRHGVPMEWTRWRGVPLVKSAPGSPYQMSFMAGWWSRILLSELLKKNLGRSPWDLELHLQPPKEMEVYGTLGTPPIRYEVAVRGGKWVTGPKTIGMKSC